MAISLYFHGNVHGIISGAFSKTLRKTAGDHFVCASGAMLGIILRNILQVFLEGMLWVGILGMMFHCRLRDLNSNLHPKFIIFHSAGLPK